MASNHLFKFSQLKPQEQTDGGARIRAFKGNFPILQGMSLYKLILQPHGIREPHWHANADELGYCLKGEILVSLYHTGDAKATFLVQQGETFLIPSGALHAVENVSKSSSELLLNFSHDDTEDFNLSSTLAMFSDAVLGNTWNVSSDVFRAFKRSKKSTFASLRKGAVVIPSEAHYQTPYKYNLDSSMPLVSVSGGSAKMARGNVWPIARRQALYELCLDGKGMREPHWHPETAELGYVKKGKGRMSILSPSGKIDTYIMEEGDIYFIPKAYPHHIENLLSTDLEILIFFDQAMPKDIGFTASVRSFSNEILAATTNNEPAFFDKLQKNYADLFIVNKINPVDS